MKKQLDLFFDNPYKESFQAWNAREDQFCKNKKYQSDVIYGNLATSEKLKITVMIPTYRRAHLLKEALLSTLYQTGISREQYAVIVVDNEPEGGTETEETMRSFTERYQNIVYCRNQKNLGLLGNWNRCIELCPTEYFCFLHDDDMLMPDYLASALSMIEKYDFDAMGVHRKFAALDEKFEEPGTEERPYLKKIALDNSGERFHRSQAYLLTLRDCANSFMPYLAGAVLRKKACVDIGGFDVDYQLNDRFFVAKMVLYHRFCVFPKILYRYRIGVNQGTDDLQVVRDIHVSSAALVQQICARLGDSPYKQKWNCTCELHEQFKGLSAGYPALKLADYYCGLNVFHAAARLKKLVYLRHKLQRNLMYIRGTAQMRRFQSDAKRSGRTLLTIR